MRGLTFIELIISVLILGILASIAMPISEMNVRRVKEIELKRALRKIRTAIDKYYEDMDKKNPDLPEAEKYPKNLEELVQKFYLRRIPVDPMTGKRKWLIKGYGDSDFSKFETNSVYDICTESEDEALDGTKYNTW